MHASHVPTGLYAKEKAAGSMKIEPIRECCLLYVGTF